MLNGDSNSIKSSKCRYVLNVSCEDGPFTHLAFDLLAEPKLLACSSAGTGFIFDFIKNTYCHFCTLVNTVSAVALKGHYALLVTKDNKMQCIETINGTVVSEVYCYDDNINNNSSPSVTSVTFNSKYNYAMTSSSNCVILWRLPVLIMDMTRQPMLRHTILPIQRLNFKSGLPGPINSFFSQDGDDIFICLINNSIQVYSIVNLSAKNMLILPEVIKSPCHSFAVNQLGNYLAVAGSDKLYIWNTIQLKYRAIDLPFFEKKGKIIQLAFVEFNKKSKVAILFDCGSIAFVNCDTWGLCRVLEVTDSSNSKLTGGYFHPFTDLCALIQSNGKIKIIGIAKDNELEDLDNGNESSIHIHSGKKKLNSVSNFAEKAEVINEKNEDKISKEKIDLSEKAKPSIVFDKTKLREIVKNFGEFGTRRVIMWKTVLKLPNNRESYKALNKRGKEYESKNPVRIEYPEAIKNNSKEQKQLKRLVRRLYAWSPLLAEINYLVKIATPFVQLVDTSIQCFEMVATIICNWCLNWFEYFPAVPVPVLASIETILNHHCKELLCHYSKHGITSQVYAWPILSTFMTEVLPLDEWSIVMDHVLVNQLHFLLCVIVAYNIVLKQALMKLTKSKDFLDVFSRPNPVSVKTLIKQSYEVFENTPSIMFNVTSSIQESSESRFKDIEPLPSGAYPFLPKFPEFSLDYRLHEKKKLEEDLAEYEKNRATVEKLNAEFGKLHIREEQLKEREAVLRTAEEIRRRELVEQEHKITEQRMKIRQKINELKQEEIKILDEVNLNVKRERLLEMESQVQRVEDEVERKCLLREAEFLEGIEKTRSKMAKIAVERLHMETMPVEKLENDSPTKKKLVGIGRGSRITTPVTPQDINEIRRVIATKISKE